MEQAKKCKKCNGEISISALNKGQKICEDCQAKNRKKILLFSSLFIGLLLIGVYFFINQRPIPDSTFEGITDTDSISITQNTVVEEVELTKAPSIINIGKSIANLESFKREVLNNNAIPSSIRILFPQNNSNIIDSDYSFLEYFVSEYKSLDSSYSILIEGYTCDLGSDNYNMNLAKKRAQVVKSYFVSNNISSDKISIKSYGESKFEKTANIEESRKQNRKVTINIIKE